MNVNEMIAAYRAWLLVTPKIFRVSFNSNIRIALTPQSLWDAVNEAFSLSALPVLSNVNNSETLDGFAAWYNQIFLPSQA